MCTKYQDAKKVLNTSGNILVSKGCYDATECKEPQETKILRLLKPKSLDRGKGHVGDCMSPTPPENVPSLLSSRPPQLVMEWEML